MYFFNLSFVVTLSLILSGSLAKASLCSSYLSKSSEVLVKLPGKNNSFSAEDIAKLSAENRYLLSILNAGISVLDQSEVVDSLKALNQPLSFFVTSPKDILVPDEFLNIFKRSPLASQITENYVFFTVYLGSSVSEGARQGLSLLFSQVKRPKHAIRILNLKPENEQEQIRLLRHFENLVSNPRNAIAIVNFFENEKVQQIGHVALNRLADELLQGFEVEVERAKLKDKHLNLDKTYNINLRRINRLREFNVDLLKAEYSRNRKFSFDSTMAIIAVLEEFSNAIYTYYYFENTNLSSMLSKLLSLAKKSLSRPENSDLKDLAWEKRLSYIENFILDATGFTSNLNDITYVLDHLLFGSSTPLTTEALESSIENSIKSWIIPIKFELSKIKQSEKTIPAQQQTDTSNIFSLKREWGYQSSAKPLQQNAPNPNKRKNQGTHVRPDSSVKDSVASNSTDKTNPQSVAPEDNLFNYSAFSENKIPLKDLRPDKTYNLKFMREGSEALTQTVAFDKDVLKWFQGNTEIAQKLIRALNLGFARNHDEDGLKILKKNRPGQVGRYYELKAMGYDIRFLVHHYQGHWTVLKVTDKTNINRVVENLL